MIKGLATFSALAAAMAMAACTVHQSDSAPSLTGPSEFAQSISITSNPDRLTQDGQSQSAITIQVFDASGSPVNGVPIRVDMLVGGTLVDFGRLSARNVVTLANGRATVVYTAPAAPPPLSSDTTTTVTIRAIAVGTNAQSSNAFSTDIRLVPPGVILPPADTPTASFTVSPTPASANVPLNFDASGSFAGTGAGAIISYAWTFGDGSQASGRTVTKTFSTPGTFNVTLTVTNDRGLAASTTQAVSVGTTSAPTASFTFSPTAPAILQPVNFNAAASSAAPGRSIVSYSWNYGDGSATKGGVTSQHDFGLAGTYSVSLTVTDDVGQRSTATQTVTVGAGVGGTPTPPTAAFVFSPASPQTGQTVNFNAAASRAGAGQTIRTYSWNFGDGATDSQATSTTTHAFSTAGTYNVTLTVTDDAGQRGTTTQPVTVSGAGGGGATPPTASFVFSPTAPQTGQTVNFNADASRAGAGRTIVSYGWNFGDGATISVPTTTTTHSFTVAGTYNVTLTVTDDAGQRGTATQAVTIAGGSGGGGATAPTPAFTFSPSAPGVGETVFFNASASSASAGRSITSYNWTFGDGATGTGVTPTHVYTTAGQYGVQLTVTDNGVPPLSATSGPTAITVGSPPAPTAEFTVSPTNPVVDQSVVFDAATSRTGQGQTITKYEWNFGDGTPIITCPGAAGCGASNRTISHSFPTAQTYSVNLVVTDSAGRIGSIQHTVQIFPATPAARLTLTKAGGTSITADGSASSATGTSTIVTYSFSWGDPTGSTTISTSQASHTYLAGGTYTVVLTVTDNNPGPPSGSGPRSGTASQTITVP